MIYIYCWDYVGVVKMPTKTKPTKKNFLPFIDYIQPFFPEIKLILTKELLNEKKKSK